MPNLPRWERWRVAVALGLVTIFLLEAASVAGAVPAAPVPRSTGAQPEVVPVASVPQPFSGFSEQTLELLNGTLVPGDRDPASGLNPNYAIADPAAGKIFVLSSLYGSPNLDVINATSYAVMVELPVPGATGAAALDVPAGYLLLAIGSPNGLLLVNTTSDAIAAKIPFPDYPGSFAVDPLNGLVYVLGNGGATGGDVTVVNVTSESVVTTVAVGSNPDNIVADQANGDLYVANSPWGWALPGGGTVSVIDGSNNSVIATIHTGNQPSAMAVDLATDQVYILDQSGPTNLTVVNATTNNVSASLPVSVYNSTGFLAVDPATSLLYVGQGSVSNLSVFSTANDSLVRNVSIGYYASEMALDPTAGTIAVGGYGTLTFLGETNSTVLGTIGLPNYDGGFSVSAIDGRVYIPDSGSGQIQVVNGTSHAYVTNVTVGVHPDGILHDPLSGDLYVTNRGAGTVTFVNGTTEGLNATVHTGWGASQITLCASVDRVAVTNTGAGTVSLFNASTNGLVSTTKVGSNPASTAWDPLDAELFVANEGNNTVTVLNGSTGSVISTISGFHSPGSFAIDPSHREVFAMGAWGGPVSVINSSSLRLVANVSLGNGTPVGIAYDPVDSQVWGVTNWPNDLMAISGATNTVVTQIAVPTGGQDVGIAIDPSNGTILVPVAGYGTYGRVFFFDPTTARELGRATIGPGPGAIVFEPSRGIALVANLWNLSISVLNLSSESAVAEFRTGPGLTDLALDSSTSTVYATNQEGGTLTILGPPFPYPVRFQATGLPNGRNWSVSLDGENASSTGATVQFGANNGTHSFQIPELPGFNPEPAAGNLTVGGAGLAVPVTFRPAYPLVFRESGLPNGTNWTVQLNGTLWTTNGSSFTVAETNGSYPFSVYDIPGWRASNYSGTIVVDGAGAVEALHWSVAHYWLNFTAAGLPSGKSWAVLLNGSTYRASVGTIAVSLRNGSYAYSIAGAPGYAPERASGSLYVSGAPVDLTVNFTAGYFVEFWEVGLPSATPWSVVLNGSLNRTTNSTVGFEVPNGAFSYSVSNVPGWRADNYSGSVVVAGEARSVAIVWNRTVYPVTFEEAGLPEGTHWAVTVGSTVLQTSTYWVLASLPNGTFVYTVANVPGWRAPSYSGTFNVSAVARSVPIDWSPTTFAVTFGEVGLPASYGWKVEVRSTPQGPPNASNGSGPTLRFDYPNGTYEFEVVGISGWKATPSSGFFTVSDGAFDQPIDWTPYVFGIAVTERGLPNGTSWGATVLGNTSRSNGPVLDFPVADNGTYVLNVSNVPGWRASIYVAYVTVQGAYANVTVLWTPETYRLIFVESGVAPPDPVWSVTFNGTTQSGTEAAFGFSGVANGTYPLVVQSPTGYSPVSPLPRELAVRGASFELVLSFVRTPTGTTHGPPNLLPWELLVVGVALAAVLVGVAVGYHPRREPPARPPR